MDKLLGVDELRTTKAGWRRGGGRAKFAFGK